MNKSKIVFKDYNQGLLNLFPCRLDENIPEHSLVRMINQVLDELDISGLLSTYQGGGTSSYHPRMLLKALFYAYLNNIYSCRKIEKVMQENIHYMWLSGSQYPSFSTINRFRSEHVKDCINSLFVQVVEMLVELGYLSLEVQYIDGTKIESVANKYSFVWKKSIEHYKGNLQKKIFCILSQIEEGIAGDNNALEDAPFEIAQDNFVNAYPGSTKKTAVSLNSLSSTNWRKSTSPSSKNMKDIFESWASATAIPRPTTMLLSCV